MGVEQRAHPRVRPDAAVPVECEVRSGQLKEKARVRDVSLGGLCIIAPGGLGGWAFAGEVELVIALPGEAPVTVSCLLKHRSPPGAALRYFGVQFTKVEDAGRDAIGRYVDARIAAGGKV